MGTAWFHPGCGKLAAALGLGSLGRVRFAAGVTLALVSACGGGRSLPGDDCGVGGTSGGGNIACSGGRVACAGSCVDTQTDRDNCGACGNACPVDCVSGQCRRAKQVVAGGRYTCALLSDGSVWCWGGNDSGQLGQGDHMHGTATPVRVHGLAGVTAISAGWEYTCALESSGSVECWGWNHFGQLGDGTTSERDAPNPVPGLAGVVAVTTGGRHACVVLADRSAKCWGENDNGELGDGTTTQRNSPTPVPGLSDVVAISAGGDHTCALLADHSLKCWGANQFGQLGDGTTVEQHSPVLVPAPSNVAFDVAIVSAGIGHTCALLSGASAGTVWCWGTPGAWSEQDCSGAPCDTWPHLVLEPTGVTSISAGGIKSCAVTKDGTAWCWGNNDYGSLGDGSVYYRQEPVKLTAFSAVARIGPSTFHMCAVRQDGSVECAGMNDAGQLGTGSTTGPEYCDDFGYGGGGSVCATSPVSVEWE